MCKISDYEIIVVDNGSRPRWHPTGNHTTLISDKFDMPHLNKPRLQNIGIEASRGDVISFLDADAIVACNWMANAERLQSDPNITRLCYRVRKLPEELGDLLFGATEDNRSRMVESLFSKYDTYPKAHEGYGLPERNTVYGDVVFGNSHFSMRRDVLGDLRYNEQYVGRGYEDLWFIREVWKRDPNNYRCEIVTNGHNALFNIANSVGGPDWYSPRFNEVNTQMYESSWDGMKHLLDAHIGA